MAKNRTELVAEVAEKSGKSQATVNAVLDAVFQVFVPLAPAVTRRPAKPFRFPPVTA